MSSPNIQFDPEALERARVADRNETIDLTRIVLGSTAAIGAGAVTLVETGFLSVLAFLTFAAGAEVLEKGVNTIRHHRQETNEAYAALSQEAPTAPPYVEALPPGYSSLY
jgi:hypothetical protein